MYAVSNDDLSTSYNTLVKLPTTQIVPYPLNPTSTDAERRPKSNPPLNFPSRSIMWSHFMDNFHFSFPVNIQMSISYNIGPPCFSVVNKVMNTQKQQPQKQDIAPVTPHFFN